MKVVVTNSFFESLKGIVTENAISRTWRDVRCWVKEHFTKSYWDVFKTTLKSYAWDEGYLIDIERAKIAEMIKYHEKHQRFVGWEGIVRDMKLCLSLIEIFTGKRKYWGFNGELKFVANGDDTYEVKGDDLEYYCNVKVNTKNIERFVPIKESQTYYIKHPHNLYELKARALYFKIRNERGQEWWD